MTRDEKARDIKIICDKCGCNTEQRQRHFTLFVDEGWQPHASIRFKNWWFQQKGFKDSKLTGDDGKGIDPVTAQNVARIWEAYLEAKEIGAA